MDATTLKNLFGRKKTAGESAKALADEAGVSVQKLVAGWRKLGLFNTTPAEGTEPVCPPEDATEQSEWAAAPEDTTPLDNGGACETPSEEPAVVTAPATEPAPAVEPVKTEELKPAAKKPAKTFDPAKVAEAVALKRTGAKWSKVGELLGCSWNAAWGVVRQVAPELCGGKSK